MFWVMLAAQLSAPVTVTNHLPDVRKVFSYQDVPDYLLRSGEVSLTVYTRTTVRDDGSVENCITELGSGDRKLDAYTCALIVKRTKFLPAKWIDGSPAYSVLRFPVSWRVTENAIPSGEDMLSTETSDLELSVNQLPKGARRIVAITLEVAVDEQGRTVSCGELPPAANDSHKHFPLLVPIACEQAQKSLILHPPVDASGKPLRSLQTASVHLKLDQ